MTIADLEKPVFAFTAREFIELIELKIKENQPVVTNTAEKVEKYVYGISGLARLLGCSKTTAQTIKSSGRIDKAVHQMGKTIVINAELALELMGKNSESIKNRRKA